MYMPDIGVIMIIIVIMFQFLISFIRYIDIIRWILLKDNAIWNYACFICSKTGQKEGNNNSKNPKEFDMNVW